MKKLIQVLRSRRGESMVEILVSAAVFMLLLGALNGAVGFASSAQRRAEQLREDAVVLQREVRAGTPAGDDDAAYDFRAATPDGTETGLNAFRVRVKKQTVTARTPSGKAVPFCRFAKGE